MKILQLTPRMPFPLTDGGAIGIYNITKSLAELGHSITLVTYPLDDSVTTNEAVTALSKYAKVEMVSKPLPPRWKVLFRTVFHGAYPIERRMMPEMFELLRSLVEVEKFDIVHVDHSHMGKYGLWLKREYGLPIVLREHNFEALIYERFSKIGPNIAKRAIARIHGKRLRREETMYLGKFDAVAAITNEDAELMREAAPEAKIRVIPAGVDTDFFKPTDRAEDHDSILWIGSLAWDPNLDAVRYFLTSIFPLVLERSPEAHFDVIGTDSERVSKLAVRFGDHVRILGWVPDVRDYLSRSSVLVIPLRIGGGMRLKLLDFFAAGKAVVTTSIGAEGNLARNERELLIANSSEAFAEAIVRLLCDETLRGALGLRARSLAETEYSWPKIGLTFEQLYRSVIMEHKMEATT